MSSLDKLGMCASALCVLHCLAVPLLLIFGMDTLLFAIDQEWVELVIIMAALLIGAIAFVGGYLRHRQHFIPVLFLAGFLLVVNGEAVGHQWLGTALTIVGSAIIIYAHYHNHKYVSRYVRRAA